MPQTAKTIWNVIWTYEAAEFIEIYNNSNNTIDLGNWLLETTNVNFIFAENTIINSHEYLLLSRDTNLYENSIIWG